MARAVTVLGWVFLLGGAGLVLLGLVGIAMTDGIFAALQTLSPLNVVNFITTVITLAPGILLIAWGRNLQEKRKQRTQEN